jgi:hypothetical protein
MVEVVVTGADAGVGAGVGEIGGDCAAAGMLTINAQKSAPT